MHDARHSAIGYKKRVVSRSSRFTRLQLCLIVITLCPRPIQTTYSNLQILRRWSEIRRNESVRKFSWIAATSFWLKLLLTFRPRQKPKSLRQTSQFKPRFLFVSSHCSCKSLLVVDSISNWKVSLIISSDVSNGSCKSHSMRYLAAFVTPYV